MSIWINTELRPVAADLSDLPDDHEWYYWPDNGAIVRRIDNLRYMAVQPYIYTHGIIWGYIRDAKYGYEDRWCYPHGPDAIRAASQWDGNAPLTEPDGWIKHVTTGRRRPNGDKTKEYIDP